MILKEKFKKKPKSGLNYLENKSAGSQKWDVMTCNAMQCNEMVCRIACNDIAMTHEM